MSFKAFEQQHKARLINGLEWGRFERGLIGTHINNAIHKVNFDLVAGRALAANSHFARLRWYDAFRTHVGAHLGAQQRGGAIREAAYFLTFIDVAHAIDDARHQVPLRSLRHHFGKPLRWLNFVGMLEPALYVSLPRTLYPTGKLYVWHLHAIVWGCSREELEALCRAVNKGGYRTLIPRARPISFAPVVPHQFDDVAGYICKSPRTQYSLSPTGSGYMHQYGRHATGANLARLHRHLDDLYLDGLTIAGCDGIAVLKAMKDDALRRWREGRRQGRL